jgi:hypothetical protein
MDDDPNLDTIDNGRGEYNWLYISPAGAEYRGKKWYKQRTTALRHGREWLAARRQTS